MNINLEVNENIALAKVDYSDKYDEIYTKYELDTTEQIFAYERAVNPLLKTESLCEFVKANYKTDFMYNADYIGNLLNRKQVKEAVKEIRKLYYKERDELRSLRIVDKLGDRIEKIVDNPDTPDDNIIKLHEIEQKYKSKSKTETIIKETEKVKVKDFSMWNDNNADATKEVTKTIKEKN